MRREQITYTDYNGEVRTENFYFNLSRAELLKMEMGTQGGMENYLEAIINERDQKKLMDIFCDIIDMSYGVKTQDGGFNKSSERLQKFKDSEAYSELFVKLLDADYAAEFIAGVMPKEPKTQQEDQKVMLIEEAKAKAREKLENAANDPNNE